MNRLLRVRTLVTASDGPVLHDAGVRIEGGRIEDVRPFGDVPVDGTSPVTELPGTVIPGLVDAHSHLRGIPLSNHGIEPTVLEAWLCALGSMTPLSAGDEAEVAATELLRTGVTAVQGMVHSFSGADEFRAEAVEVLDRLEAVGIRALVVLGFSDRAERTPCPHSTDLDLVPDVIHRLAADGFCELVDRLRAERASASPCSPDERTDLVRLALGPVAAQWSSDEALARLAGIVNDSRVHTHLCESVHQRSWIGGDVAPTRRLAEFGLLTSALSASHGVDLTDDELGMIAEAGATLVHCPISNARLEVGAARVSRWRRAGVSVALGLDSQNDGPPDFFDLMRAAQSTAHDLGDELSSSEVLGMATIGGARAMGMPDAGRLVPGAPADFVHLAMRTDAADAVESVVQTATASDVSDVAVAGRWRIHARTAEVDPDPVRARLARALAADADARRLRHERLQPAVERLRANFGGS